MLLSHSSLLTTIFLQIHALTVTALPSSSNETSSNATIRVDFGRIPDNITRYIHSTPEYEYLETSRATKRDLYQLLLQEEAGDELKFVSSPDEIEPTEEYYANAGYAFLSGAGSGVTVYVHDSGINLQHAEFTLASPPDVQKGTIEWLYPDFDLESIPWGSWITEPTHDPIGHGTCVADKIVGQMFGVAKGASLKMVPVVSISSDFWLQAGLRTIIKDIKKEREKDPNFMAVVNFSYVLTGPFSTLVQSDYYDLFKEIHDLDVVMVAAAGNWRPGMSKQVTDYPAALVGSLQNMIVVGSVDVHGHVSDFSKTGDLVSVYAPGERYSKEEGIECAAGSTTSSNEEDIQYGVVKQEGTSLAAPIVSGLAAYWLSIDSSLRRGNTVSQKVKARIVDLAWSRQGLDINIPAIWNGQDGSGC
ncbi:hypothetical protein N7495_006713 [Penicillium taxi]|uniref:uncharacterized protein n=1 Tax=Penicillium taxi TaxID=168475 RepID=UPI002544DBA6|nr:uncharacterized protein N7495_006713 [Penicillium taxi]KAJ5895022.1 hypothetical protein N7495_006713 [Penicillium taxi]